MTGPTGYAVAHLTSTGMCPEIAEYVSRIDATLAPFGGQFVIHGGPMDALEGDCRGDLIVIAFPDRQHARTWYDSPAYRAILPLRKSNAEGWVALVDGVDGPAHGVGRRGRSARQPSPVDGNHGAGDVVRGG